MVLPSAMRAAGRPGLREWNGNFVTADAVDDRVGSYVIAEDFEAGRGSGEGPAVSPLSFRKKWGCAGAHAAAFPLEAQIGLALEVTHATDHPRMRKYESGDVRIGAGPVLFRGANFNPIVFERLVAAAEAEGVPYQVEGLAGGPVPTATSCR